MKRFALLLWLICNLTAGEAFCAAPVRLTTDLIEHTDRVWINGYLTQLPIEHVPYSIERVQYAAVGSLRPRLGWQLSDNRPNVMQTAYSIEVGTSEALLKADSADVWRSGEVVSSNQTSVEYNGHELQPSTIYYWRVKSRNNTEWQPWSAVRAFRTAPTLEPSHTTFYPLEKLDETPASVVRIAPHTIFADFGRAAFSQLSFTLHAECADTITVRLGECIRNGQVDRTPPGTQRFMQIRIALQEGTHTYKISIPADRRNTGPMAVHMPNYIGEVYPFRYCELESPALDTEHTTTEQISLVRHSVHYPFDRTAASFSCSDTTLNRIWELCKYSIEATSFTGIYIDGDRERIPYEGDALINQLGHYATDREFAMARRSHEYLLTHATWPTEWILQSVLIAWNDYLYTGDDRSLKANYDLLRAKSLQVLADESGLIHTVRQTPELTASIHLNYGDKIRDIVDWPQSGEVGVGKAEPGEADAYVFKEVNTVVNAYHYRALVLLSQIARVVDRTQDAQRYEELASRLLKNFNAALYDAKAGAYRDGIGTDHHALHASMMPLAFGMVEPKNRPDVLGFVRSRGMACSVFGAQFLLDGVFDADDAAYGLSLLGSTAERSWYNMIRVGSTITLEAWDNRYKPNQDWNHAWGAAPANLIPRKLMGIEPTEPGFSRMRIHPRPDTLGHATISLPTIRGTVKVEFTNNPHRFCLNVELPAGTMADIFLPLPANADLRHSTLTVDGVAVKITTDNAAARIAGVGSGSHTFELNTIQKKR